MLAMNGRIGTPTTPEAQVKIFRGMGVKPTITSNQNAFHGDSATTCRRFCTCSSMRALQPSHSISGCKAANAKWPSR